jgi:hypothetical protein
MKIIKILLINFLVFFTSILIIELIFGGWFKKDNFGAYFREHRMKKVPYKIKYNGKIFEYVYKRNYHGFIGEELNPKDIKAVFIGGSTADERWKPRENSIAELINKRLEADKIDIKIVNSAIEGQSTVGYIANFKYWYPKLEDFKPKYFIFYTGINELLKTNYDQWDFSDGMAKLVEKNKEKRFKDNLKSKSFFYDSLRKIKHKYYTKKKSIFSDLDQSYPPPKEISLKKYDYLNFKDAYKNKVKIEKLLIQNKKSLDGYLKNIDLLVNFSKSYSAKAIIINQVTAYGAHHDFHLSLNYALDLHCKKMKYFCIDIASDFQGKEKYWYDWVHTTPLGSEVISKSIYPKLVEHLGN